MTLLVALALLASAPAAPGPRVGERIPDFQAPDTQGQVRDLGSLSGPAGLVLVFFRSADW